MAHFCDIAHVYHDTLKRKERYQPSFSCYTIFLLDYLVFFDFPTFFATIFFFALDFGFFIEEGRHNISLLGASLPQESQTYFKLMTFGAHICRGLSVTVPQYLHTTTFFANIGLQR
jgi:hypothetical protein